MLYIRTFRRWVTSVKCLYQSIHMQLQLLAPRSIAVKRMETPMQKAKCVLCLNRNKYVKEVQLRYLTEFGVDPLSKPSIHAFHKLFFENVVCVKT
jgi:hypothetical protein